MEGEPGKERAEGCQVTVLRAAGSRLGPDEQALQAGMQARTRARRAPHTMGTKGAVRLVRSKVPAQALMPGQLDPRGDEGPRAVGRKPGNETRLASSPRAPYTHLVWTGVGGWAGRRGALTSCSMHAPPPPPPAPPRHPRGHLCRRQ